MIVLRLVPRYADEEEQPFDPREFSHLFAECGHDVAALICDKLGPEIENIARAKLEELKQKNARIASIAEQQLNDGDYNAFLGLLMPMIAAGIGSMLENFTAVQRDELKRLRAIQDLSEVLLSWHYFVAGKEQPEPEKQEEDQNA